jgi:hypothetical protein
MTDTSEVIPLSSRQRLNDLRRKPAKAPVRNVLTGFGHLMALPWMMGGAYMVALGQFYGDIGGSLRPNE